MKKKRLAIFALGGIGVGVFSQGLPTIGKIVERLGGELDITFYSLDSTDPAFRPVGYLIRSPPRWVSRLPIPWIRWFALLLLFLGDHLRRPHQVLMSLWGYPMGTFVVALARLVRRPSVVLILGAELANLPAIEYGALRRPWSRRLVSWTCRKAARLVVISEQQRELLRENGVARADVEVIPWGVDPAQFPFVEKAPGVPLKIVHVANLTEVKDQATLVQAFALVRERLPAKLRIVGPDFMNGRIHALVTDLGLTADVEFVGAVPFARVVEHYRWADLFLLTSLSEGQNGAVTEAVACGVLAVGTPVGLIHDLGDEAAVIVTPGDPDDIAAKVVAVVADRDRWAAKVARAHEWSQAHTFDWTIAALARVMRDA
ncbi:MAG TPA: glycosyltransferase [Polyangia bacterium]